MGPTASRHGNQDTTPRRRVPFYVRLDQRQLSGLIMRSPPRPTQHPSANPSGSSEILDVATYRQAQDFFNSIHELCTSRWALLRSIPVSVLRPSTAAFHPERR